MHIPDGFLTIKVSAISGALSAGSLTLAVRSIKSRFEQRAIPLMGVLAAFVFAAQMFNFPVAGGTSGHLIGGVLCAVILGPMAASIILSCVLVVQCLLFQDGGLAAIGANILNMAIAGTWSGWILFYILNKILPRKIKTQAAVFAGAWFSVVIAAALAAIELGLSGTVPIGTAVAAMVGVHAVIGIGEGVITLLAVSFLRKAKPELLP
jgi:cobalt/nickel transport system permease protein